MISFFSEQHGLHAPAHEIFRGERVPCFETPSRAEFVRQQLQRADVLFVSLHGDPRTEYPFYLGHADETGEGAGAGFNLNLPLAAGSGVAAWFEALEWACRRIARHEAQALVVSLGLDAYAGDPISRFALQPDDFSRLGQRLAGLGLPTVFVLEGG